GINMQNAILAILSGNEQATRVADALKIDGFSTDEISIMLPDEFDAQELAFGSRSLAAEAGIIGAICGSILGAEFALVVIRLQLTFLLLSSLLVKSSECWPWRLRWR